MRPMRVARVQRRVRILEDHLHPSTQRTQVVLAEVRDVLAVEDDRATGRLVQPEDRPADRRLPAARLADEPERLAALDVERHAVDGLHVTDVAIEDDAALDREVDLEVAELEQIAVDAHGATTCLRKFCHSSSGTGLKHATLCPRSISSSGGTSWLDSLDLEAAARLERARSRRTEHVSRSAFDRVQTGLARGVEPRNRLEQTERVRVARLGEQLPRGPGLHEHARVHHVDALAHAGDDAQVVRDHDQRRVLLGDELAQQVEDLRLDRHVERGRRLVGDQELSACRRGPSRSSRAGACPPRTGAGSRGAAGARSGCRRGR